MKKRYVFRLLTALCLILLMTAFAFADNVNTDDDAADYDGEYTFSYEGEKYGYESYLNSDLDHFVGARLYQVTIPDDGRLICEISSSQINHMTVSVYSYELSDHVCEWDVSSDSGVNDSRASIALPAGKYSVTFSYTRPESSIIPIDEPGEKRFRHYISWKADDYIKASSVTVSPSKATLSKGNYLSLNASVSPSNAFYKRVKWSSSNTGVATVDQYGQVIAKSPGTAVIKATNGDGLVGKCTVTVPKYANTLKASGGTVKLKYKTLRKKTKVIKRSKVITVTSAKGKVTYSLASVSKAKFKKYFKVNSTTGKITVKKKLKKRTYKVKIKVKAAGNTLYKPLTKTVTVKVVVK